MNQLTLGILREGKTPPDSRVPLTPEQCFRLKQIYPGFEILVERSNVRCFSDHEYQDLGITLTDHLEEAEVLLGVKEVPVHRLLEGKTYFMFSHTIKKQPYNRKLLQEVLNLKIRLIDWECLTSQEGVRVIAFGYWAGVVGAHNGMMAYGKKTGLFSLPQMVTFKDFNQAKSFYNALNLPPMKIVLTGTGRVATGSVATLRAMNIRQVAPEDFLKTNFAEPVFTQLDLPDMYAPKSGGAFNRAEFFALPDRFVSRFLPYTEAADFMINGIFWERRTPKFFNPEDIQSPDFRIRVVADISCDIAPDGSIPVTIRPSSIQNPVYGIDRATLQECSPGLPDTIDVMAIDNLPNELPRDASADFGEQFLTNVAPALAGLGDPGMLLRATIAENGHLTAPFSYLEDYVLEG